MDDTVIYSLWIFEAMDRPHRFRLTCKVKYNLCRDLTVEYGVRSEYQGVSRCATWTLSPKFPPKFPRVNTPKWLFSVVPPSSPVAFPAAGTAEG